MDQTKRKMWQSPWGYKEGFAVAFGITLTALILQFLLGNINPADFSFPINFIFGIVFLLCVGVFFIFSRKKPIAHWLASGYSNIPAILILVIVVIIMGLTPQFPIESNSNELPNSIFSSLGWYQMTTSWFFLVPTFYLLVLLEFTILNRMRRKQSWRDVGFYLNHTGLFLALLGGILGSADLERLKMSVQEGDVEWRALDNKGILHELPIAIELDTFIIEEYPPKLVAINTQTGEMLPENKPDNYVYNNKGDKTLLNGYHIEVLDYLPSAGLVQDSNNVNFVPFYMEGAAKALKLKVTAPKSHKTIEGWVSNGSFIFPYHVLYVDSIVGIAMPRSEVKRYTSKVSVYTEDGITKKANIEVNKPLNIESWIIYQLSYDETKGKYSDTSVFELVRDPWIKMVYAGIIMMMAGALFLFIAGPKKLN